MNHTLKPIGIFGGTFDPVHLGHLRLAEEAHEQLGLEKVLWIPAGQPPLRELPLTPAAHRLAMVAAATVGQPAFELDASEVFSEETSYTVKTLERLRDELGDEQPLVLLVGADAFSRMEQWHEWQRLFELAHIAIATRPGYDLAKLSPRGMASPLGTALAREYKARHADDVAALSGSPAGEIVSYAITPMDISATAIRNALAERHSIRYLVGDVVLDYIYRNKLYR